MSPWGCAAVILGLAAAASAQNAGPMGPYQPWVGALGVRETIAQIMERDAGAAIYARPSALQVRSLPDRSHLAQAPGAKWISHWPLGPEPLSNPGDSPQTFGLSLTVLTSTESGFFPPDPSGAVGPTQMLLAANGRIKVFDKVTGATGPLNATTDSFFASVRNGATAVNPQARFDRLSGRFFVLMVTAAAPNRFLLAVSSGPVITSVSSFSFFYFDQDAVAPTGNLGMVADFPSLGVDASALYTGANMYGDVYAGCSLWVIQKASVLGAGPIVATAFRNVTGAAGVGMYSPRGVYNPDPGATLGYFVGVNQGALGSLVLRRVSSPAGAPSLSGNITLTVPATSPALSPPAPGSSPGPETGGDRLLAAQIIKSRATGQNSLWTSHAIQVNSAGVASVTGGRAGSRWYEIGSLGTTPALVQSGTLYDSSPSNPLSYFIPSIGATGQGHMAIASSVCGATTLIGCAAAGRLSSNALGLTQAPSMMAFGGGTYQMMSGGRQRWGDYSATVPDPADDQTLWTFQQYCDANNSYAIRMTRLVAPPPAIPVSCAPASVQAGAVGVSVTVTGLPSGGAAFYDTDPSWANRLAVSVGGTGVTVTGIALNPSTPMQFVISLSVTAGAALGPRSITVVNPDGQSVTSDPILSITPAQVCPVFTIQPQSQSVRNGQMATFTAGAQGIPAPTFQWFKNSQLIPGATEERLTIGPLTSQSAGRYECVATNACGAATSQPATLTVTCYPDCDSIGGLTANDFLCFVNAFATNNPSADCDLAGGLTANDFLCFVNAFVAGCP